MANPDDALNDELQAQMSGTKNRAGGWIGSRYVGIPAATAPTQPAPKPAAAPKPVGSQGKKPGEWVGSKYVGPATAPPAPPPVWGRVGDPVPPDWTPGRGPMQGGGPPLPPGYQNFSAPGAGSAPPSNAPAPPPVSSPRVPPAPPSGAGGATTPPPLTSEQIRALTPAQRRDYYAGKINADGTPKAATAPPPVSSAPAVSRTQGAAPPAAASAQAPASARPPYTREEYDRLTDEQKRAWSSGASRADVDAMAAEAPPPTAPTTPPAGMTAPKNRPVRGAPKIDDPTQMSHKYVGLRHLRAGGTIDSMLQLPEFAGWTKVGSDKVRNPDTGAVIDVTFDDESELQWSRVGGTGTAEDIAKGRAAKAAREGAAGGAPGAGVVGGAGGAGGEGGTGGFGAGGAGGQGGGYPFPNDPALDAAIARLLSRGEAPVTRSSIADQYDPVAAQIQRNTDTTRAAAAERAAFEGTNVGGAGGAFDASVNSINERGGQQQSELMANLITGELTQRRADVMNAIGFAQGEQKMRLQAQLAALDRELERQRMAQQNQQYYDDLGFQIGDREMYYNERESDRL